MEYLCKRWSRIRVTYIFQSRHEYEFHILLPHSEIFSFFFLFPLKMFFSYESSSFFSGSQRDLIYSFFKKVWISVIFNITNLVEKYIKVQNSIENLYPISSHYYMYSHWIFFINTIILKRCFHGSWTDTIFSIYWLPMHWFIQGPLIHTTELEISIW